jgi:hypothetical protein
MSVFDKLRDALQEVLDDAGDGWQLAHYTIVLGIQQMTSDGHVSSCAWMLNPIDQPGYVTEGLLSAADSMLACGADIDDD